MRGMAQCESKVFFPDQPAERPQFSTCPRQAETTRRTWRSGDRTKQEPKVIRFMVKLCGFCARELDENELDWMGERCAGGGRDVVREEESKVLAG
jgi:hypothetical protein